MNKNNISRNISKYVHSNTFLEILPYFRTIFSYRNAKLCNQVPFLDHLVTSVSQKFEPHIKAYSKISLDRIIVLHTA